MEAKRNATLIRIAIKHAYRMEQVYHSYWSKSNSVVLFVKVFLFKIKSYVHQADEYGDFDEGTDDCSKSSA